MAYAPCAPDNNLHSTTTVSPTQDAADFYIVDPTDIPTTY